MNKYIVTIQEYTGDGFFFLIVICFLVIALFYIVIPGVIIYLLYQLIKWIIKRVKKRKEAKAARCTQCRKLSALEHYKRELVGKKPRKQVVYGKDGSTSSLEIIDYKYRTYYKCKYCSAIIFSDEITDKMH